MSYLNEKTLDIVLEENTDFGYRIQFSNITEECTEHPITGEPTNCKQVTTQLPVDMLEFSASISDTLKDSMTILESFTISMTGAEYGTIEMHLDMTQVNTLAGQRPNNMPSDTRARHIGYYDLISYDPVADITTRVMEGKVYVSDGVTT